MAKFPTHDNKLFERLRGSPSGDSFPDRRIDYFNRFQGIDEYLNVNVHPHVNAGAAANDEDKAIFLTDHGPEHIASVMRRIVDLLGDVSELTPYETYILLLATHLHDTGNIFGRKGHERRVQKVMNDLGDGLLGNDGAEKRMIRDIAVAHGGYVVASDSNQDTIGALKYSDKDRGARTRLLAALLRFGDELADDYTRTSRFLVQGGAIHPSSEVYHYYADRLQRVRIDLEAKTVYLSFEIAKSLLCRMMQKGASQTYLIDEIKARCLKMHREQIYCSRFLSGVVDISCINVTLTICDVSPEDSHPNEYSQEIGKHTFLLQQAGYPGHLQSLKDISPQFDALTGKALDEHFSQGSVTSTSLQWGQA